MDIEFHVLQTITNSFSDELKVGSGGYGDVYKAVYNGKVIAVKKLHQLQGLDDRAFDNEFRNLSMVKHQNVVRLLGYCYQSCEKFVPYNGELIRAKTVERILCFDYMHGGSLDKHIKDESCDLDWPTCYQIIRGTSEGLNHLHSVQKEPIYHLDLKPENVLLDRNMVVKIGDLGLSSLVASTETHKTETINVKGTLGYMPPEYKKSGYITEKYDIFSLGVIILKILAGNKGYYCCFEMSSEQFTSNVIKNWERRLQGTSRYSSHEKDIPQVKKCVEIALKCVEEDRKKRPYIKDIVHELQDPKADLSKDRINQKPKKMVESASSKDKLGVGTVWQAVAVPMDTNSISYKDMGGQCTEQPARPSFHAIPSISCNQQTKMSNRAVDLATGAMGSLRHKLGNLLKEDRNLEISVKTDIESLSENLREMQLALHKVSEVHRDNLDDQVKHWADNVREMSYDIEDVVDGFLVHIEHASDTGFFTRLMHSMFNLFTWGKNHNPIKDAINDIKKQVQVLSDKRKRYKVDETLANVATTITFDPRILAIYKDQKELVGIKEPRNVLIKWLSDKDGDGDVSKSELKIVSIVGIAGLGKTTLAKAVYDELQSQFGHRDQKRAFVSVGQNPNVKKVFKDILRQLGFNAAELEQGELIDEIQGLLKNKRYFIVIDDIWDSAAWKPIKCAFIENNLGSIVVTTTRNHDVANDCCMHNRGYVCKMKPLNDQDSRKLFISRIFGSQEGCPNVPGEILTDILKKCGGLPLAIISIASLLAHTPRSRWDSVRNSLMSLFEENHDDLKYMEKVLDLSYMDLPHHLKTCLLDIGKYPEDSEIPKEYLLRQWTSLGFVSSTHRRDAEDVAEDYFYKLINMSMIQPGKIDYNDEVLSCRVHDIMLDLIRSKAAEENFNLVIDGPKVVTGEHKRVRRVSIHYVGAEDGEILAATNGPLSHVRSVLLFSNSLVPSFLVLKYIRVLHIENWWKHHIINLTGIRGLFMLRYLKICSGELTLPSDIGELRQLETIEVEGLYESTSLPSDIVTLPRLCHLSYLDGGGLVLPDRIGMLKSLRTLRGVDFLESSVGNIKGLGELTNLRELEMFAEGWKNLVVKIDELEEVRVAKELQRNMHIDALCSSIGKLSALRSLIMGKRCMANLQVHGWSRTLAPPCLLRKLDLRRCEFQRIPKWIALLRELYSLTLFIREVADGVGIVAGLPSLAHLDLYIGSANKRGEQVIISGKEFGALKYLSLDCPYLSLVFQAGALPRLEKLHICFRYFISADFLPVGIDHLPAGTLREIRLAVKDDDEDDDDEEDYDQDVDGDHDQDDDEDDGQYYDQFGQHRAARWLLKSVFERHHPAADITIDSDA